MKPFIPRFLLLFALAHAAIAASEPARILFFGDSLTAGHGVQPEQAFPALIQKKIDQAGYNYRVINAGLSGDTSAGGVRRIDWILRQPIDIFVLELGGNDGLRGLPTKAMEKNLQTIFDKVKAKRASTQLVVAGMQMPTSMGVDYPEQFAAVFPRLAEANDATLIPFLLTDVGGNPRLNQPDGIHPTPAGHKIVAKTVWAVLEPMLRAAQPAAP